MGEDKEVNTGGGAYVGGNVNTGSFIGRDSIGTQIINYFQGGLDPQQLARARTLLLKHVYDFWVDGVLHKSLHNEILLSLGMETRFGAVDNRPWDMILQTPTEPDRPLPLGTKISTVFDHSLLILGTPGAGKTTVLLELARDLLARAEQDPADPIPVVFNLSSWAVARPPLETWLADELNKRYPVSKKVAQHWVEQNALLLLLDGLDEVQPQYQNACIDAINGFHQERKVDLVVCSRLAGYEEQQSRLHLERAILLQPLTLPQVDEYLDRFGTEYSSLRIALNTDETLQELAETPLLLNIMMVATQEITVQPSEQQGLLAYRQTLFNSYIQSMFMRRGSMHPYSPQQTMWWLVCLAEAMVKRRQTVFLIEGLQSDWLILKLRIWGYKLIGVLSGGVIGALILGLIGGLLQNSWLGGELSGGMIAGLIMGLSTRLIIGLIQSRWLGSRQSDEQSDEQSEVDGGWLGDSLSIVPYVVLIVADLVSWLRGGGKVADLVSWPTEFDKIVGPIAVLMGGMMGGMIGYVSLASLQYGILRTLLWLYNLAPLNYAKFLDYCAERIFLRRVGGGYIFIHRMLMEHFAAMTKDDIDELVQGIK